MVAHDACIGWPVDAPHGHRVREAYAVRQHRAWRHRAARVVNSVGDKNGVTIRRSIHRTLDRVEGIAPRRARPVNYHFKG